MNTEKFDFDIGICSDRHSGSAAALSVEIRGLNTSCYSDLRSAVALSVEFNQVPRCALN